MPILVKLVAQHDILEEGQTISFTAIPSVYSTSDLAGIRMYICVHYFPILYTTHLLCVQVQREKQFTNTVVY